MEIKKIKRALLFLLISLIFVSTMFPKNPEITTGIYSYCKSRSVSFHYNYKFSYIRLEDSVTEIKIFLKQPYIYYKGNIFYMGRRIKPDAKGEYQLFTEYVNLIDTIFGKGVGNNNIINDDYIIIEDKAKETNREYIAYNYKDDDNNGGDDVIGDLIETKASNKFNPYRDYTEIETNRDVIGDIIAKNMDKNTVTKDDIITNTSYNIGDNGFRPVDAVIIDAGHGGKDPGGIGVGGIQEKEIVLDVSFKVAALLKKNGIKNVILTRKDDTFLDLNERTEISANVAKKYNAIFVCIHANISLNKNVSGLEIYTLSEEASDNEALAVAATENKGFTKKDIQKAEALYSIIGDLMKDEMLQESEEMSRIISASFIKSTGARLNGLKKAKFYVLKYNVLPSVLIEIGYMSNPSESKSLMNTGYRQKMSLGIASGIINYINNFNKSRGLVK